jgi:hypothetical protein
MSNPKASNTRRPKEKCSAMRHRKESALDLPEHEKARADEQKLDGSATGKDRERKEKRFKVGKDETDFGW